MYSSKIRMRDSLRSPFPSVKTRPLALFFWISKRQSPAAGTFFYLQASELSRKCFFSGFPNILTWPQALFFGFPSVKTRPQALFWGGVKCQNPAAGVFFLIFNRQNLAAGAFLDSQVSKPGRRRFFFGFPSVSPAAGVVFGFVEPGRQWWAVQLPTNWRPKKRARAPPYRFCEARFHYDRPLVDWNFTGG